MSKIKFAVFMCFILLTTLGCNTLAAPSSPTPEPAMTTIVEVVNTPTAGVTPLAEADVPRISPEQAKAALESGAAIIIDVRSREAYAANHITGAINIPLNDFESNPTGLGLDKNQWIITYCT